MPKEIKECLFCKKQFETYTGRHVGFCSRKCSDSYRTKYKIKRGGPRKIILKDKICFYCLKFFKPKKPKQEYCSIKCVSLDPEIRKKRKTGGLKNKGRKHSTETRKKISELCSKREAKISFTKGKGGIREDLGFYLRSSWEANIARVLKYLNIDFQYESEIFKLNDGEIHYRPDFKLQDNFIEVKGWWTKKSILIKDLMEKEYPEIHIVYVSEKEYSFLREYFREKIKEWENEKRGK